jgi:hypothetical protein
VAERVAAVPVSTELALRKASTKAEAVAWALA